MTKPLIAAIVISMLTFPASFAGSEGPYSGWYRASIWGNKMKAQIHQKGKKIHGVAYIYDIFGHKSTYHFTGTVENGKVVAQHFKGHTFQGNISKNGKISGVLRTRKGRRIKIKARKR